MSNMLKVRPFVPVTTNPEGTEVHLVSAVIENGEFCLRFDQATFRIPFWEMGTDELGPFAMIKECDTKLPGGSNLRVEAEFEEPLGDVLLPPRCHICIIVKENPAPLENQLREAWIDPASIILLAPVKWSLDVYFFSSGKLENVSL